jgi:hypothetical protein
MIAANASTASKGGLLAVIRTVFLDVTAWTVDRLNTWVSKHILILLYVLILRLHYHSEKTTLACSRSIRRYHNVSATFLQFTAKRASSEQAAYQEVVNASL